jgi:hypothetical protein
MLLREEPNVSSAIQFALADLGYERMSLKGSTALYVSVRRTRVDEARSDQCAKMLGRQ